ncbi:ABC transporter permease [Halocola ammonii]
MKLAPQIPSRHIIVNLIRRNMKLRYKSSLLGYLWSFLTPLLFLLIFHFVFSQAFQGMRSYSLYVLSGLILWQFFANGSNQCIQSLLANAGVIKTINVPVIAFPIATIFTELFNMGLVLIPFFGLMLFFGLELTWHTLLVIPVLLLMTFFSLGLGLLLGSLNIYLRDISILWNSINPALFYLTPVAYTLDFVPENYHPVLKLNPLYHYFQMMRDALYYNQVPSLETALIAFFTAAITFFLGLIIFKKLEPGVISNV